MPLPAIAGDTDTLLSGPGMSSEPSASAQPSPSPVNNSDQVRGIIQQLSGWRQQSQSLFDAISTQVPTVAKATKDAMNVVDQVIRLLVKETQKTVQMPEPSAPGALR